MPSRLVPAELQVEPNEDGIPGAVILFVDDGLLSYLEYVYYADEIPTAWPVTGQLSVHRGPRMRHPESASRADAAGLSLDLLDLWAQADRQLLSTGKRDPSLRVCGW